jgi:GNAT superfamily N-acetyltransferase
VIIRPIEPEDVDRLERLFYRLSPETIYRRFMSPIHHPRPGALAHLANVDHTSRDALVALDGDEIIGVARYDAAKGLPNTAEVAIVVEDAWQRHGIARQLLNDLAQLAARRGFTVLTAFMLGENRPAAELVRALNPNARMRWSAGELAAEMPLRRPA